MCLDEWEMVNISQIEMSKIPVVNAEGKQFNLQSVVLNDTDDKPVSIKLGGKEQYLVLVFFSFESLGKDIEYVRYYEEKKPDFVNCGANVMMISVDSVADLLKFRNDNC